MKKQYQKPLAILFPNSDADIVTLSLKESGIEEVEYWLSF